MNLKKNFKRFWTMQKHTGGFTLVELIVVIAILAILAGVGIPAYSGYITKANMAADQKLIGEVKQALELGYYAGNYKGNVYVAIGNTPEELNYAENAAVAKCLADVFGENFAEQLVLKHDDWNSNYTGSSFSGKELELLAEVDGLTDKLAGALATYKGLAGESFLKYANSLGISEDDPNYEAKLADAAVLYVAKDTGAKDADKLASTLAAIPHNASNAMTTLNYLRNNGVQSTLSAAAAVYAMAEGFCRHQDALLVANGGTAEYMDILAGKTEDIEGNPELEGEEAKMDAFNQVFDAFAAVQEKAVKDAYAAGYTDRTGENSMYKYVFDYFDNQGKADANAYIDVLGMVSGAESTILENVELGSEDCFSSGDMAEIFEAYAKGAVLAYAEIGENGNLNVESTIDE